jgi:hypothetical protein
MAAQISHPPVQLPPLSLLKATRRFINGAITLGKRILGEPPRGQKSINHILAFSHR